MPEPSAEQLAPAPRGSGTVFVTGAGGFIGRHTVSAFVRSGWRCVALSNRLGADDGLALQGPHAAFVGPVSAEGLRRAAAECARPELVIHAAGGSSVGASLADPKGDFERTVGSVTELLSYLAAEARDARLIFLSSAAVYGQAGRAPLDEDAPTAPVSPYGLHKRKAEELVEAWSAEHGLDAAVVRFFSVYGAGNRKQIFWDLAHKLAQDPARVELGGTGDEARDFLHVADAVRLMGLLADLPRREGLLTVNGGSGRATTVREAAEALARALDCRTKIAFTGDIRPGDPSALVADAVRVRSLGFRPRVTLDEGLRDFAAWARPLLEPPHG